MSSTINLVRTKFVNLATGEETYGFRIYDEYSCAYSNTFETSPSDDDMDFLSEAIANSYGEARQIFNNLEDMKAGICIDGECYSYRKIKKYLQ